MDQEVAKTLGELELKLQQLEHELSSIGHDKRAEPSSTSIEPSSASIEPSPAPIEPPSAPTHASGKLIDEAIEQGLDGSSDATLAAEVAQEGDGFGGPPVFGGEEIPSQAGATIERDWTVEARETAYGEIPTPPALGTPPGGMSGPPIPPPAPTPQPPPGAPLEPPVAPPAPPPSEPPRPIDVAELVRFKEKMRRTLDELVDEYSELLEVDRSTGPHA